MHALQQYESVIMATVVDKVEGSGQWLPGGCSSTHLQSQSPRLNRQVGSMQGTLPRVAQHVHDSRVKDQMCQGMTSNVRVWSIDA